MTLIRRATQAALAAATALALAGCVTVFPKTKPSQLYRFGDAPPPAEASAAGLSVGVARAPTSFARAVSGDRILTLTGAEAAYIGQARWVSPASVLFDEAVARAFDANPGAARLVARGGVAQAPYRLALDVRDFQVVYDNGRTPTVVVRVRAVLTRVEDRTVAGDELFAAEVKARRNRVGDIVEAFDAANGQTIGKIVAWTNARVAPPAG